MATFNNTYGPEPMLASVAWQVNDIQRKDEEMDIHTITLVLNGQHGEFDLTVEATDDDMEEHRWTGVAHRYGGVSGFKEIHPDAPSELTTTMQRERYWALIEGGIDHDGALKDARKW